MVYRSRAERPVELEGADAYSSAHDMHQASSAFMAQHSVLLRNSTYVSLYESLHACCRPAMRIHLACRHPHMTFHFSEHIAGQRACVQRHFRVGLDVKRGSAASTDAACAAAEAQQVRLTRGARRWWPRA